MGPRVSKSQSLLEYAFGHSLESSAELILSEACAEVQSAEGLFVVLDDVHSSLVRVAEITTDAAPSDEREGASTASLSIGSEETDWNRCFRIARPIALNERCRSPRWPFYGPPEAWVDSALYVPVEAGGRIRAVFAFFGGRSPYGEDDATRVIDVTGSAIRVALQERALLELREVQSIYNSVVDVLFTLSVEGNDVFRFTSVNRSFLQATGLSRDSVVGRDFRQVIPAPAHELVLSKYRQALAENSVVRWEEVSVYPAGTKYGEVSVRPILDAHGRCTHLVGTVHDITDYRLAAEELKETNEKYRTFIENSTDAILLTFANGGIIEANPAACEMFGRTEEELLALQREALTVWTDPRLAQFLKEREQTGRARGELLLRRRDNSTFPAEISSAVFEDANGNLRASIVAHDISNRIAAQERIERNERYFRALIENATDIVLVLAPDGLITYCSPSVERILGYAPDRLVGKRVTELAIFGASGELEGTLAGVTDGKRTTVPFSTDAMTPDGQQRRLSGIARNAVNEEAVGGIVVNLRDVTAEEHSERERERLRNELEQARKMESVGRLAGGVAHDFNNHLTVILGHVELMISKLKPGAPGYDDLVAIQTAANRSAELTRQLLAFGRRQSIRPQVVDLNQTVDGMLRMLHRLIGENIELHWKPGSALWSVKLDLVQVDQILVNLCLNARDAINGSGRITIRTENRSLAHDSPDRPEEAEPGEYVVLSVSDTGSGMDEETRAKVFEPFFTTKDPGSGTGLGAATVYGIVKQNQGYIGLSSEVGKGTTFSLFFRRDESRVPEVACRVDPPVTYGHDETILFVEDDRDILAATSKILESMGYRVLRANGPLEALRIVENAHEMIDLVITDVVMPRLNGKELSERVRRSMPKVKILFVSGYTADVIAVQGVLNDGVNFLEKPYRFDMLAAKIQEILAT